jgi:transposase
VKEFAAMGYRRYTREFKQEACKLGADEAIGPGRAAKKLGMPEATLRLWMAGRGLLPCRGAEALPASNDPAVLRARIVDLEAQLRESEIDKEILKKAAAYFAREQR